MLLLLHACLTAHILYLFLCFFGSVIPTFFKNTLVSLVLFMWGFKY